MINNFLLLLFGCLQLPFNRIRPVSSFVLPSSSGFSVQKSTSSLRNQCFSLQSLDDPNYRRKLLSSGVLHSSTDDDNFVDPSDLEALQGIFTKYRDSEGLMSKTGFKEIPAIAFLFVSDFVVALITAHTRRRKLRKILNALELLRNRCWINN